MRCVDSDLCGEMIILSEESYRARECVCVCVGGLIVCDLGTSKKRLTRPVLESCVTEKEITLAVCQFCVISNCIGRWDFKKHGGYREGYVRRRIYHVVQ